MQLIKEFFSFGSIAFLNKIISFVTLPILASNFSVSEYGELDLLASLISFAAIASCFGTDSAVGRLLSAANSNKEISNIVLNGLLTNLIFLLIIFIPVTVYIKNYSAIKLDILTSASLIACIFAQVAFNFNLNIFKWTKDYSNYKKLTIYNTIAQVLMIVGIVYHSRVNVAEYMLLTALCILISVVVKCSVIVEKIKFGKYSSQLIINMISYGVPYGIISCIGVSMPLLERHIVLERYGSSELGIYAIASKFAGILIVLATAYQIAWGPEAMGRVQREEEKRFIYENTNFIAYTLIASIMIINLLLPMAFEILHLKKFDSALYLFIPMATCVVLQSLSKIADVGIAASKKVYISLLPYIPVVSMYATLFIAKNWILSVVEIIYLIAIGHLIKYCIVLIAAYRLSGSKLGGLLPIVYLVIISIFSQISIRYEYFNGIFNNTTLMLVLLIFPVFMSSKFFQRIHSNGKKN